MAGRRADSTTRRLPKTFRAETSAIERDIKVLLEKVPTTYPPDRTARTIALMFAHRGIALWRAYRYLLGGPSVAAANMVMRALVDLNITMGWLLLEPDDHITLWEAEYARNQSAILGGVQGSLTGLRLTAEDEAERRDVYREYMGEATTLLKRRAAACRPVKGVSRKGGKGSFVPSTVEQAKQLEAAGGMGAKDLYEVSFRYGSQWTHATGGSFLDLVEADGEFFNEEHLPADTSADRMQAATLLLALLSEVDKAAGLCLREDCDRLVERMRLQAAQYVSGLAGGSTQPVDATSPKA